jgi:hypothetical protein
MNHRIEQIDDQQDQQCREDINSHTGSFASPQRSPLAQWRYYPLGNADERTTASEQYHQQQ